MFPTAHSPVLSTDGATRMVATNLAAATFSGAADAAIEKGPGFACSELDALAVLLASHGYRRAAAIWIMSHQLDASNEDVGDRHYRPDLDIEPTGAGTDEHFAAAFAYLDALTVGDLLDRADQPTGGEADAVHRWVIVNDDGDEVDAYATIDAAARAAEASDAPRYVITRAEYDAAHATVTCERHGGPWGEDDTCSECTDAYGDPRDPDDDRPWAWECREATCGEGGTFTARPTECDICGSRNIITARSDA